MKVFDSKAITVVGGLPHPLGGVTGFISRLAANNMISEVIDVYPSEKKNIPPEYSGSVCFLKGLSFFVIHYWVRLFGWKGRLVHFNFSTARSLLIFLLLPKMGAKFALMLHHGELHKSFGFLSSIAISKIDLIFCMNEGQERFYKSIGVPARKIVWSNSYIPPVMEPTANESPSDSIDPIDSFFFNSKVLTASGYPTSIYNHDWCIRYTKENPEFKLALFLYGDGAELERLTELASTCSRVRVFRNCSQSDFNYALSRSLVYLRPTSKDSFGIAVADAVSFGIKALASNVCRRYPGTYIFKMSDYKGFCMAVNSAVNGDGIAVEVSAGFNSFNYPSI